MKCTVKVTRGDIIEDLYVQPDRVQQAASASFANSHGEKAL
jgi:hypothetical protein